MQAQAPNVELIERASVAAVSPDEVEELPGWLLAFDAGSVNRAKSAVPLRHAALDADVLPEIIDRYTARGHAAQFRLADLPPLAAVHEALSARGFVPRQPTVVQLVAAEAVPRPQLQVALAAQPDADWLRVFGSDGAPASRAAMLARAPDSVYASAIVAGETLAVGALSFGFGFGSVQGMRTLRDQRGRGLAGAVLGALADVALRRGVSTVFLQVEADNLAALRCYARAGFEARWVYRYWRAALSIER